MPTFLAILLIITGCSAFQMKGTWGKDAFWPVKGSSACVCAPQAGAAYPELVAGIPMKNPWRKNYSYAF